VTDDNKQSLLRSIRLHEVEPLHKRVPTHDEDGRRLSDCMILIPKLRDKPKHLLQKTVADIERILVSFNKTVVFAELNLKLNLLWISVRPRPGITFELAGAIQVCVPEAKLVSHL